MKDIYLKAKQDKKGNIWVMLNSVDQKILPDSQEKVISPQTKKIKDDLEEAIKNGDVKGKLSCSEIAIILKYDYIDKSKLNRISHALRFLGYKSGRSHQKRYFTIE
jgi:hypothetical protein